VVFISPTLIAENPLSGFAVTLTGLPVLGSMLLNKLANKKSHEFIEKSFYPQKPSPQQRAGLHKKLNRALIWKGAIRYKQQQQKSGLQNLKIPADAEVIIVRGELDASVTWSLQENALRALIPDWNRVAIHVIEKAGHALPWTEPDRVARIVRDALQAHATTACAGPECRFRHQTHNVVSFLKKHAETSPQKIALRWVRPDELRTFNGYANTQFGTRDINFHDFYRLIGHLAKGLNDIGLRAGDRVILFLPMSLEMYAAMFAIQHIGAIAVFLDSWARRNQLGASAKCVAPKAMISHKRAFDAIAGIAELDNIPLRIIAGPGNDGAFAARLEDLLAASGSVPITAVRPDDTALITFTTGSSGDPKGANRTHRFLHAQHAALKDVVPYNSQDSDIPAFPIFSLNNLASGVTTLLPAIDLAQPHHYDAAALASQILHEKVTCTTLSPSMLNALSGFCQRNDIRLTSIRRVITGGAPISRDNVSGFRAIAPAAEIWILYGSTEVEPMAHIEATEMLALDNNHDAEIVEEGVNVGRIANGLKYKFIRPCKDDIDFKNLNWAEWEVAENEVGEFIVSGDHVCADYYNNQAAFHRTKIREKDGTVWHRTGDLARLDEHGYLWIVGRVHNMVRRQDHDFFPVKAEIILNRCAFVRKGAFLGLADARLGERTAVVVEFADGQQDRARCIKEIMRLFHKNKIIVDSLYAVDAIPMDPRHHSKVEYSLLRRNIHEENIEDLLAYKKDRMESDHAIVHDSL
jgi:acyl-CoA synthetase (AMP-forming)/AMP-acid ligase II